MKLVQHALVSMTGHGLETFLPAENHWATMENLETVALQPVHLRKLLRVAP